MNNDITITEMREIVEDLARQFAYPVVTDGVPCLSTGGHRAYRRAA